MQYTNEELIEGIRLHKREILNCLYKEIYYQIRWLIVRNHGTVDDAYDIFQDAMIVIYRKILHNELFLKCSMSTYIYSICRFLWLKELSMRKRLTYGEIDDVLSICEENEYDDVLEKLKVELYLKHFNELGRDCKKILNLHLNSVPIPEITLKMGYRSDQYTMERKYRCKIRLIKKIINNPMFRRFKDGL